MQSLGFRLTGYALKSLTVLNIHIYLEGSHCQHLNLRHGFPSEKHAQLRYIVQKLLPALSCSRAGREHSWHLIPLLQELFLQASSL